MNINVKIRYILLITLILKYNKVISTCKEINGFSIRYWRIN
jgi:hypothetical protein